MRSIQAITTFIAVAQAQSFAGAARQLGLSTTAISRHVADLEQALGVALLRRTTRIVTLTEAGSRYLPRAQFIIAELDDLHREVARSDQAPKGTLRVTAPPGIGNGWIGPLVTDFLMTYPDIDLELDLSERVVDLLGEGFDAAIRAGDLPSSSLIAHRIITIDYRLCASPSYLREYGAPAMVSELKDHACLFWNTGSMAASAHWTLQSDAGMETVPVRCRLRVGNLPALRHAALSGLGLAILPSLDVRDDLAAGRLIEVMPSHQVPADTLSLVRPPAAFVPAKLRAFMDFVTAALRQRTNEPDGAD